MASLRVTLAERSQSPPKARRIKNVVGGRPLPPTLDCQLKEALEDRQTLDSSAKKSRMTRSFAGRSLRLEGLQLVAEVVSRTATRRNPTRISSSVITLR